VQGLNAKRNLAKEIKLEDVAPVHFPAKDFFAFGKNSVLSKFGSLLYNST